MVNNFGEQNLMPIYNTNCQSTIFKKINCKLKEHSFLALPIPSEYNGFDCDAISLFIALDKIARYSIDAALFIVYNNLAVYSLLLSGSDTQKLTYLIDISEKGRMLAFCPAYEYFSEEKINVLIQKNSNSLILKGSCPVNKYQAEADYFILLARVETQNSKSAFRLVIVDRSKVTIVNRGVSKGFIVKLEEVKINETALMVTNQVFQMGLMDLTAIAVGIARQNVKHSLANNSSQESSYLLTKILSKLESTNLLAYKAAYLKDQGLPFYQEAFLSNLGANEVATETCIYVNKKNIEWESEEEVLTKSLYLKKLSEKVLKHCEVTWDL